MHQDGLYSNKNIPAGLKYVRKARNILHIFLRNEEGSRRIRRRKIGPAFSFRTFQADHWIIFQINIYLESQEEEYFLSVDKM